MNGNLTIVFVGASFDLKKLPPMVRVRLRVIGGLLNFLASAIRYTLTFLSVRKI
jgi:hypothetical protein